LRRTIFLIPNDIPGPLPLFGYGLMLIVVLLCGGIYLFVRIRREGLSRDVGLSAGVLAAICAAVTWVIPFIMGDEEGLPVRGYGVFLLLTVIAGLGVILIRARQMGVKQEIVFNLAFAMFIAGIIGARLLYVLQYWDHFEKETWGATFLATLNMTKGGLVVYGAFLGSTAVFIWYVVRNKLPLLALADVFVGGLVLGQGIGRIGCLMNGCCYGGVCENDQLPRITFPWDSPPHHRQAELGDLALHGLKLREEVADGKSHVVITGVQAGAEGHGIAAGDRLLAVNGVEVQDLDHAATLLYRIDGDEGKSTVRVVIERSDGTRHEGRWTVSRPLPRSLPTHPAQIYDAINGLVLFLFAWVYFPFRRRDGQLFATLLTIFPITRFLMEWVRIDESQSYLLGMTISQVISVGLFLCSIPLWAWILRNRAAPLGPEDWAKVNRKYEEQQEERTGVI
jgi:phosphatidylglycerol:prolipoprotein diacylglycerol transferase